ncbi:MAG: Rossman fold protein, TIGR00730 family [Bacteroidetes bacterium CG2_30_33_31]|nr:MAG: Rossman fold protein, TIGR00730 family [Bacteroidetes bacterium CG2_30_33_31]
MNSIGVFCGSSIGAKEIYSEKAAELGRLMAKNNIELVFGGGKVGLMGIIADEVLTNDGQAIGVIPKMLKDREVGHENLSKMHIVENMSDRKNLINDLSDAFIAMPGGFGTLDEVMEVLTYFQLGWSEKPVGFLNVDGFYDKLIMFLDHILEEKFMKFQHRHNVIFSSEPAELIKELQNFVPLAVDEKWINDLKQKKTY